MSGEGHVAAARAVYDASADAYVSFVGTEISEATEAGPDRAALAAFADLVAAAQGTVADLGTGPGRVAGFLAAQGIDVVGVDVSEAMLAAARAARPGLRFETGSLTALPFADASLSGAVAWYSIIYTPPDGLPAAAAEIARVLAPGAYLLIGFHAGAGDAIHRPDVAGTGLPLTTYHHDPDTLNAALIEAGFHVYSLVIREPELPHESAAQAFLTAQRSS